MGIRYYAYPVLASDLELARRDPLDYMNHNPIVDDDDPDDDRLVLALDKSWRYLQHLFVWPNRLPADPCLDLVRGDVHYPNGTMAGYLCYYEVLEPDVVARIATHIQSVDKVDVLAMFTARLGLTGASRSAEGERLREDVSYVGFHLDAAKAFCATVAAAGHGIVYRIG